MFCCSKKYPDNVNISFSLVRKQDTEVDCLQIRLNIQEGIFQEPDIMDHFQLEMNFKPHFQWLCDNLHASGSENLWIVTTAIIWKMPQGMEHYAASEEVSVV